MNTRKAYLKKLRLPTAGNTDSRDEHQKATSTISNFFTPEPNPTELLNEVETAPYSSPVECIPNIEDDPPKRAARTKLSTFLPKENRLKAVVEKPISNFLTKANSDDFEKPAKNIKKAPKAKTKPRPKRQQKIKTVFLKNEELFSAVTAQHCLAENINPDEMQMALALSRSEADVSGVLAEDDYNDETSKEDKTGIRGKLKKFGFRVAEKEDYNLTAFMPTKKNTKWGNKFTALTLRNPKRQLERVNQKVEEFLSAQFITWDTTHIDEKWSYSVKSEVLLPLVAASDHLIVRPDPSERVDLVDFYVLSLFEPSTTKAGHLLKDVRRIAGRDRTPVKRRSFPKVELGIDPQFQSPVPVMKKSRYDEVESHDGLSLPCPNAVETLGHSISPLPATIGSFPNYDADISTDILPKNIANASPTIVSSHLNESGTNCDVESVSVSEKVSNRISTTSCSFAKCGYEDAPTHRQTAASYIPLSANDLLNDFYSSALALSDTPNESTDISTAPMSAITATPLMTAGSCFQSHLQLSSIRSTSPDIFGDSDVEMEEDGCGKREEQEPIGNKSSSSDHEITTYERFSSDDVKTFSDTKSQPNDVNQNSITALIDLTQCSSDTNSMSSEILLPPLPLQSYQDHSHTNSYALHLRDEKPSSSFINFTPIESKRTCFSFGSSASEEFYKSKSFSQSQTEESIDLTQNSDEEDACILLTDDEINYSIWKTANNSSNVKEEEEKHSMSQNVTIDHLLNGSKTEHEFSFLNLVADTPLLASEFQKTQSNSSLDLSGLDLSKRSDFGILEEQSPFKTPTKTPKKSPRKTPTSSKCRRTLSASFAASPMESTAPLKRFSSMKKFSEFTKSDSFSDLDDIDKLIYGSPSKKSYKKPAGLEQLLTGAISEKIESPQKAAHEESPKEFEFNGRTYLVRTANVADKPNYATMDESTLLDQLYRYGIRKLNRKQAVRILEYVYNQTHPCLVDEIDIPSCSDNDKLINEHREDGIPSASKFHFKDCWGHILVSDVDVLPEIENEKYIIQTNTSKKFSTALLPFHVAWKNLVKSNKLLHEAILHYEPIDLQEVYLFFKSMGYRYDPKELKGFFDSRSIIFRYDLSKPDSPGGAGRHVRKNRLKRSGKTKKS